MTEVIQREQDFYRRLQTSQLNQCDNIVHCIGFSDEATHLAYMANGDLRKYLENNRPSRELQLSWACQMARALVYIHERRVLVTDIATRNMLLDFDLCLKFCDFSEASVLPLDADLDAVDDNGTTTRIDIGQLGAVIYEIATGEKCEIDLFKDNLPTDGRAAWPKRKLLPTTEGIWLGSIIEGCWVDGGFQTAKSLLQVLKSIEQPSSPRFQSRSQSGEFSMTVFSRIKDLIQELNSRMANHYICSNSWATGDTCTGENRDRFYSEFILVIVGLIALKSNQETHEEWKVSGSSIANN